MSAGFPATLGVVRVQVAPDVYLVALPQTMQVAIEGVDVLSTAIGRIGDSPALLNLDRGDGLPCWFRARDVITIDVVSTEDPSS